MEIHGRGVLITGGSRGLGAALARALSRRGASVVVVARELGPLEEVVASIRAAGGVAHAIAADVGEKEAIHRISGAASALVGPIDILVHDASTLGPTPLRPLLETECEDIERALAVNVMGPFRLTKAIAGGMLVRGEGTIVVIGSDAAVEAYPRWGAYGASKAAVEHLARTFAAELAEAGVRVFAVDPGEMDTRMHEDALGPAQPGTLARPEDVAEEIVAMIAEPARAANGARLVVKVQRPLPSERGAA
jgi:NAD(P)-dependent dehydrogenase (short-subunit alcohol dehydrogenase family)